MNALGMTQEEKTEVADLCRIAGLDADQTRAMIDLCNRVAQDAFQLGYDMALEAAQYERDEGR